MVFSLSIFIEAYQTMTDFIELYPNALSPEFCKRFIHDFERSPHKNQGRTGGGVDTSKKISQDIYLNQHAEFQPALETILQACITHITEYVSKYYFSLISSIYLGSPRLMPKNIYRVKAIIIIGILKYFHSLVIIMPCTEICFFLYI